MTEKKVYVIRTREVHVQDVAITATSLEKAIERVSNAEGVHLDGTMEYSHMLDPETWLGSHEATEEEIEEFDLYPDMGLCP